MSGVVRKSDSLSTNMTNYLIQNSEMISASNTTSKKQNLKTYYETLLITLNHSLNIIKASMMRLIFSLHSLIAIFYVYFVKQDEWYFVNVVGVVFLIIELLVTIIKRRGQEPRWLVSLVVFFYLFRLLYSQ